MKKAPEDTPLIKQFFAVKAQYPEAVLLYRVGDFYESYASDAVLISKVLGLVLTGKTNGEKGRIEMAGFPHHALESYLPKLVRAGYKVAVCDQLEDPKLAENKKLVKRGVTELVTPGVAFRDQLLEQKENNFLAGLTFDGDQCGAAFLDVSTGSFQVAQGSQEYIGVLLSSLAPKELVVERGFEKKVREKFGDRWYISSVEEWAFSQEAAAEKLRKQLGVRSLTPFRWPSVRPVRCSFTWPRPVMIGWGTSARFLVSTRGNLSGWTALLSATSRSSIPPSGERALRW